MKNTKKKLKNQSKVGKSSFQQVDVASSLSKTQANLVLHSFIATFPGSNITKYSGVSHVLISITLPSISVINLWGFLVWIPAPRIVLAIRFRETGQPSVQQLRADT